jgi:hypothetical protein
MEVMRHVSPCTIVSLASLECCGLAPMQDFQLPDRLAHLVKQGQVEKSRRLLSRNQERPREERVHDRGQGKSEWPPLPVTARIRSTRLIICYVSEYSPNT